MSDDSLASTARAVPVWNAVLQQVIIPADARSKIKFARKCSLVRSDRREVVSHATGACVSLTRIDFDNGEANTQCRWPFHSPALRLPCGDLPQQSVTPVQVVCMFVRSRELMTTLLPSSLALLSLVWVSPYLSPWDYCAVDGIIDVCARRPHGFYAGLHRIVLHARVHEGHPSSMEPGSHGTPTVSCW